MDGPSLWLRRIMTWSHLHKFSRCQYVSLLSCKNTIPTTFLVVIPYIPIIRIRRCWFSFLWPSPEPRACSFEFGWFLLFGWLFTGRAYLWKFFVVSIFVTFLWWRSPFLMVVRYWLKNQDDFTWYVKFQLLVFIMIK